MERNLEIEKELREIGVHIPELKECPVFHIPKDYFFQLPQSILDEIHIREITENFSLETPFSLPENYFEALPDTVMQRLINVSTEEEINELSPVLSGLRNRETYQLPEENYFEQKPKKVIPFPSYQEGVQKRIRWTRWIAAAAVACLFALGGYNYLAPVYQQMAFNESVEHTLASIPDNEIQEYLSVHLDANEVYGMTNMGSVMDASLLNGISDKDIEAALENYSF